MNYKDAECRDHPDVDFFPSARKSASAALELCQRCVVRAKCLEDHLDEIIGVYGGTTGKDRVVIRNKRNKRGRNG